jgi:hypothetical protein
VRNRNEGRNIQGVGITEYLETNKAVMMTV